jgi:hypothetical protein
MTMSIPRMPLIGVLMFLAAAASQGGPRGVFGQEAAAAADPRAQRRHEIEQRLQELDSPFYETRRMAAEQFERWVAMPNMASMLAEQFQQLIVQPELPLEVRWRILIWRTRLPLFKSDPPQSTSREELERLVSQLDDDSFAVRAGSFERLRWIAASEPLAKRLMLILKRHLANPLLSEESYRHLEAIRNIAWGIWLNNDAPDWNLPPVPDGQIDDWLSELSRPADKHDLHSAIRRRIARQELLDVMTQDREVPRVKAAIEAHLRGKLDQEGALRLRDLLDLTRPAMVAESWCNHKQTLEQHLIVGVPMHSQFAEHPSHFDSANDQEAHCVSGNALLPGKYQVGVAFPAPHWHSENPETVFDLVNLPTPRRQIAYSYYVKTDPAVRLSQLSRRTLDRLLAEKKLLTDPELGMLAQLDAREVSHFASRYFLAFEDGMVEEELNQEFSTSRKPLGSQSSRFGAICAQLAVDGTREAAPGLLEAIRQRKFISPTPLGPYRLQWLAALSIAQRDPWPEVDAWLIENIDNKDTVIIDHADGPEIGATAAGLLLIRHNERPAAFGLQNVVDTQLAELKLRGFRYGKPDDVEQIRQWWKRQSQSGSNVSQAPKSGGS